MCAGMQRIDVGANRFTGNLQFLLSMPYLVEIHLDSNQLTGEVPPVFNGPLQVRSFFGPLHYSTETKSLGFRVYPEHCLPMPLWIASCLQGASTWCPHSAQ